MKKGGLGRGLSALIPESGVVSDSNRITDGPGNSYLEANPGDEAISVSREPGADGVAGDARLEVVGISDIEPNRYQPCRVFDTRRWPSSLSRFERAACCSRSLSVGRRRAMNSWPVSAGGGPPEMPDW